MTAKAALFLRRQLPPGSGRQVSQPDIYDAHPLKADDPAAQVFAHTADLTVQALGQDNPEAALSRALNPAGPCHRIENRHSLCHFA